MFNSFGDGPPLFVVVPIFVSAQTRFQSSIYRRKLYVADSCSGWVAGQIPDEWAEWLCQWLGIYRAERGLEAEPAVLFLDNAPSRNRERAMQVFLEHNVRVILFSPHMTHVMQPVDICWARPFKSKTADAWSRTSRSLV
jgi:hypothetical protein